MTKAESYFGSLSLLGEMRQRQELNISAHALRNNEWAHIAETQELIREDREYILAAPTAVHTRVFVGPSVMGKTTIAAQWARVNENDETFARALSRAAGSPRRVLGIHFSLSEALKQATSEEGLPKEAADERHRQRASELITQGVDITRKLFTGHPTLTVIVFVDVVGITQSDLGTTAVAHLARGEKQRHEEANRKGESTTVLVRFFAPEPNEFVEREGLDLRDKIRLIAQQEDLRNVDEIFKEKRVYPGRRFKGKEELFVKSCGMREAWERHWRDIYQQLITTGYVDPRETDIAAFLADSFVQRSNRFSAYISWLPERLEELGVESTNPDYFRFLPNIFIQDGIHTHFTRLYQEETQKEKRVANHHFPLYLLGADNNAIKEKELLTEMGIVENNF